MSWFFSKSKKRNNRRTNSRSMRLESLEERRLMAADLFNAATVYGPVQMSSRMASASTTPALIAQYNPVAAPVAAAAPIPSLSAQTTVAAKIDLDVTIDSGRVVPTQAKDLNLLHFFGGEKLTVPTVVKNYGPDTASGSVTVTLYLSTTRDLTGSPILLGSKTTSVTLGNGGTQRVELDTVVPTSLAVGTKYFLVAKITTPLAQSTINDVRPSVSQFEFVGTPTSKAPFEPNAKGRILYFDFIRDTFNGSFVIEQRVPGIDRNNAKAFIAHWEGDVLNPYLDSKGIPTIGVGVNLTTLSATTKSMLAASVRQNYLAWYGEKLSSDDNAVITMLQNQAKARVVKKALDAAGDQALFNAAYKERQQQAINQLSSTTWSRINSEAKIAVMDLVYNAGSVFPNMAQALQSLNYVRAGFELVNAKRTTQEPGLTARTEADYQNLLYLNRGRLGAFAKGL